MPHNANVEVQSSRLDNGLRLVLCRQPRVPLVAVNLRYHVGSRDDPEGGAGLAHLIEHLLFTGTQNLPDQRFMEHVRRVGGVANGSTWFDWTKVFQVLPAEYLELALWLESERITRFLAGLSKNKLDKQKQIVLHERRQLIDSSLIGKANEAMFGLLYPQGHPYRAPIIGYPETLERLELATIYDFFRAHYNMSNAVLTVAGDISIEHASNLVEEYFGGIPEGVERGPVELRQVILEGEQYLKMSEPTGVSRVYRAYHLPPYGTKDWYAADLLTYALTSGRTGILTEDLVEEQKLALAVQTKVLRTEETSSFWLMATGHPSATSGELRRRIDYWMTSLAGTQLPEDCVERAKNWAINYHSHELQLLSERTDRLSLFATFFDKPEEMHSEIGRYSSLTADDLYSVVQRYFSDSQRVTLVIDS